LSAQEKFEKESRISRKEVPHGALLFVDSLKLQNNVKWYLEEGLERRTIEAKFKRDKVRYSIEFDTLGHIEDIETETEWKNLENDLRASVSEQLGERCSKHSIVKVQKHHKGNERELLSLMLDNDSKPSVILQYELIVRCRHEKSVDLYEYQFTEKGMLITIAKIIFRNSSHLEY
jgi:hypothetical protein